MPKSRDQKSVVLDRLTTAFKGAKSVAFANYQGITVAQADELRKKARAANVTYLVAKKTLFTKAAKQAGLDLDTKQFPGMLGAAFGSEDEVAPAKVLGDMTKTSALKLVGGYFEGAPVSEEKVIALSKLPGKQELLAMLVGTLNGVPGAFVRALNAIREQAESKSAPAPKEEPKAEAPATSDVAPAAAPAEEAPAASAADAAPAPADSSTDASANVEEKKEDAPAEPPAETPAQ